MYASSDVDHEGRASHRQLISMYLGQTTRPAPQDQGGTTKMWHKPGAHEHMSIDCAT